MDRATSTPTRPPPLSGSKLSNIQIERRHRSSPTSFKHYLRSSKTRYRVDIKNHHLLIPTSPRVGDNKRGDHIRGCRRRD